jgi:hypothetical protein
MSSRTALTTNALSVGDSGKRGFPVVEAETAEAVKLVRGETATDCVGLVNNLRVSSKCLFICMFF